MCRAEDRSGLWLSAGADSPGLLQLAGLTGPGAPGCSSTLMSPCGLAYMETELVNCSSGASLCSSSCPLYHLLSACFSQETWPEQCVGPAGPAEPGEESIYSPTCGTFRFLCSGLCGLGSTLPSAVLDFSLEASPGLVLAKATK